MCSELYYRHTEGESGNVLCWCVAVARVFVARSPNRHSGVGSGQVKKRHAGLKISVTLTSLGIWIERELPTMSIEKIFKSIC